MIRKVPAICLALVLSGGGIVAARPALAEDAAPISGAQRLAAALAAAADAERSGSKARLARAVRAIDGSGARPLELDQPGQNGADPLPAWRARAGSLATVAYRGRPLGPGYRSGKLNGGGQESFSQLFLSGKGATIALSAPTGDQLGLRVLDPQSRPICEGGAKRSGMCRWVPLFTQRYTIEVTNLGAGDARYFLVVE